MKTTRIKYGLTFCAVVLMASAAFRTAADQPARSAQSEESYTGTVTAVDPQNHTLKVKGWMLPHKSFDLGDTVFTFC